jgi:hypothetical protein
MLANLLKIDNHNGAAAILMTFIIFIVVCIGALVVDLAFLFVASEQLQNSADAGALAGARELYLDEGTQVNEGANLVAHSIAVQNNATNMRTEAFAAEVNWTAGNSGDVQRGHWSFGLIDEDGNSLERGFYPSDSLDPVELWGVDEAELDANPNFINAVRVVARRESSPLMTFFAHVLGIGSAQIVRDAVAYIGFAGTLREEDVDQPIAICADAIVNPAGEYTCSIGRFINSGQNDDSETGGWTSFDQEDNPCSGGTNAQEVSDLVCGSGNPDMIVLGRNMATNGGQIQSAFDDLYDCWVNQTSKSGPWNMKLPVVTCPSNNMGTCEEVVGAVVVNVIWITGSGDDPHYNNAPQQMSGVPGYPDWDGSSIADGATRWQSFTDNFHLKDVDGESSAPYSKKSIYFIPDCEPHIPIGGTGGRNFGILARIPVLVE